MLLALKISTVGCHDLKHIPTVHDTPDSLFVILFQSCAPYSPAFCLNRSAFFITTIPMYYVTYADSPTNIGVWNKT